MNRLLFALLLIAGTSQAGSIQKWVDKDGNVHYGDSPPATIKAEKITVTRPPSNPGRPLPRLGDLNAKKEADAGQQEQPASSQLSGEETRQACQSARANLDTINRSGPIRLRSTDGSERLLSTKEIDERRARYEQDIKRYCK